MDIYREIFRGSVLGLIIAGVRGIGMVVELIF